MRTRNQINKQIKVKEEKIKSLKEEITALERESLLLSDRNQWFIEKEEELIISKRPKKVVTKLIGRIYWNEAFVDEDTGEVVEIERSMKVRENNHWV